MPRTPEFPLHIFYDGSCSVCAGEVEYYRRKDMKNRLLCIDISAPDFDPSRYNITLKEFMYELHAIDQRGTVYKGVESFWAIWQAFPSSTLYGLLGTIIQLPGIHALARVGYQGFAGIRPFLPKRKPACADGTCRIGKRR